MKINYDDIEIDATDLLPHLETYAKAILYRMQKSDSEYSYCWTACNITFDGLSPEFQYGSVEDTEYMDGHIVKLPITKK